RSVAILKCLGASVRQVLATYVLQVVLLGLTGSLLGVVLAAVALSSIAALRQGRRHRFAPAQSCRLGSQPSRWYCTSQAPAWCARFVRSGSLRGFHCGTQ